MKPFDNIGVELADLLQEATNCVTDMAALLESEREALRARDTNTLKRLIDAKHQRISMLEMHENNRKALLHAHGYATDRQGMEDCLNNLHDQQRVALLWQQLLVLLDHCHHLNRVNGNLLNLSYRVVKQVMQILQGRHSEDRLYDPYGHEIKQQDSHSLAKL